MTSHIVVLSDALDTFSLREQPKISVFLNHSSHEESVRNSTYGMLAEYGREPSPEAVDFLNVAIAAYSADVRTPRGVGFDRWTRDFHVYMPVFALDKWTKAKRLVEEALSFLTGDHWVISFRASSEQSLKPKIEKPKKVKKFEPEAVSLFSGGLDSFIGALDLLKSKKSVVLVGHHAAGEGPTSVSQRRVFELIRKHFDEKSVNFLKVWVSPKKQDTASENTTRGRSLLFVAIGLAVANSFKSGELYIPENGLISLNVPLTNSRLGSFSTRTTHPHFVFLLRQLIDVLNIPVKLILPYRFKTKGEMLEECKEQAVMQAGVPLTMSCSHPSASRYAGVSGMPHCGYCVPCIIRQASTNKIKKDSTAYLHKLNTALSGKKGLDLKVFRMALERYQAKEPSMFDVLSSGPIPGTSDERRDYLEVFKRGLKEVRELINKCS